MSKAETTRRHVLLAVAILVAILAIVDLVTPSEAEFTASIFKPKDKVKDKEKNKGVDPEPQPEPESQAEAPPPSRRKRKVTVVSEAPPPDLRRGNLHPGFNVEPTINTWFMGDTKNITITINNDASTWDSLQLHLYITKPRTLVTLYRDIITVNPGATTVTIPIKVPYMPGDYSVALSIVEEYSGEAYTVSSNHKITILSLPALRPLLRRIMP